MTENLAPAKPPRRAKSPQPGAASLEASPDETGGGVARAPGVVAAKRRATSAAKIEASADEGTGAETARPKPRRGATRASVASGDRAAGKSTLAKPAGAARKSETAPGGTKAGAVAKAARRKVAARAPKIPYTPEAIAEIFRRFAVQRPEPQPELEHKDAFTLLVAVVLSAQATDSGVNRATRILFSLAETPQAMAALPEEAVREAIRTIGLYRTKARNVAALAGKLVSEHGGAVPRTRDALEALPGVGRKTANVVLNTAFGEETLAVDTHILRIGNRLKIAPGKTPEAVEEAFLRIIPAGFLRHAHHWLILHGRYVCKARRPDCEACIIADLCRADEKTTDVPAPLVALPVSGPGPQPLPPGASASPAR